MTLARLLACLALAGATLVAQSDPRFEVASVRPATDQGNGVSAGLRITGNQIRIVSLSFKDYVGIANRMKPSQVIAPDWAAQLRFDVAGNLPDGATRDQVPEMLQALLADRFQLKTHKEMREFPVYALTVAKSGLKITGTPVDPNTPQPAAYTAGGSGSTAGVSLNFGTDSSFTLAANKVDVRKMTMTQLADALSRFTDRPVIDMTSLPDRYDFMVELTQEDYQLVLIRAGLNGGVQLPQQALRFLDASVANPLGPYFEKLGLTLDSHRAPLDVVVVDSALKAPTEN